MMPKEDVNRTKGANRLCPGCLLHVKDTLNSETYEDDEERERLEDYLSKHLEQKKHHKSHPYLKKQKVSDEKAR